MVEELIENKKTTELRVQAYCERLQDFYPGNEDTPLWMAGLAAFPVAVTIDLLYQLWANFRELKDVAGKTHHLHPLLVNDCILSPLFKPTGQEIYEMEADTRAYLLNEMKSRFGPELITDLASFLYRYSLEKRNTGLPERFHQVQQWTALLAVDPQSAAMSILGTLKEKIDRNETLESIGVANLLNTLTKENHELAEMMMDSLGEKGAGDEDEIKETTLAVDLVEDPSVKKNISIRLAGTTKGGVEFELPESLTGSFGKLYSKREQRRAADEQTKEKKGKTYAVIICFPDTEEDDKFLKDLIDVLKKRRLVASKNLHVFFDKSAIRADIIAALHSVFADASENDTILFYFLGQAQIIDTVYHAFVSEPEAKDRQREQLDLTKLRPSVTSKDFNGIAEQYADRKASVVVCLDAFEEGWQYWMTADSGNRIVFSPRIQSIENNKTKTSRLVYTLMEILSDSSLDTTYKEIGAKLLKGGMVGIDFSSLDILDQYVFSHVNKNRILQMQESLKALGYNSSLDGKDSAGFQSELNRFKQDYNRGSLTTSYDDLRDAMLVKDDSIVKLHYFSFADNTLSQSFLMSSQIQARLNSIFGLKKVIMSQTVFPSGTARINVRKLADEHQILVGINRYSLSDNALKFLISDLYNCGIIMGKYVYLMIEEEIERGSLDRKIQQQISNRIPVNSEGGFESLITGIKGVVESLLPFCKKTGNDESASILEHRFHEAQISHKLDLSNLSLTEIPEEVFQLKDLLELDLSKNNLQSLPRSFGEVRQLQILRLADNPIAALSEAPGSINTLELLDLRNTNIYRLPFNLAALPRLKTLHLDNTKLKVFNLAAFNHLPDDLTLGGLELLNIDHFMHAPGTWRSYFAPVHDRDYAILEIHSEYSRPHFNVIPEDLVSQVHYAFYSEVDSLQQLFRIIFTEAGHSHTIVYLCDEKNILNPQFDGEMRANMIYEFFDALGKPLNLIINNSKMQDGIFDELTTAGKLNFAAIRNQDFSPGRNFAEIFFETIWNQQQTDLLTSVFVCSASAVPDADEKYVQQLLKTYGYNVLTKDAFAGTKFSQEEQLQHITESADIVVVIIKESVNELAYWADTKQPYPHAVLEMAGKVGKQILFFIEDSIKSLDRLFYLPKLPRSQRIVEFKDAKDLGEKIKSAASPLSQGALRPRRMKLTQVLNSMIAGKNQEDVFGYNIYGNLERIADFSFPEKKTYAAAQQTQQEVEETSKPRNGKWILVVGTGSKSKVNQAARLASRAIGTMLAREGFNLICGSWNGVDEDVSMAFESVCIANGIPVEEALEQVYVSGQPELPKGKQTLVKRTEWNNYVLNKASAVIVIGGASLTKVTCEKALEQQIPIIPLAGTSKIAADVYGDIEKLGSYFYSTEALKAIGAVIRNEDDASRIADSLKEIISNLPENQQKGFFIKVRQLYQSKKVKFADDYQKDRWGGRSERSGKKIKARVTADKSNPGQYSITVEITAKQLRGWVALFLPNTFPEEILFTEANAGKASFRIDATEPFTLGAYTQDGDIELELDLSEGRHFPAAFFNSTGRNNFHKEAAQLESQARVYVKDDLQKKRWGGKAVKNGLRVTAKVSSSMLPGWFNVKLNVSYSDSRQLEGEVAFFLHDSFFKKIRYRRAHQGVASLSVLAYEAFTVGVYTEDGVKLELDLQQQNGYPEKFYYQDKKVKRKGDGSS